MATSTAVTASTAVTTGTSRATITGWNFAETAGGTAEVTIRDGGASGIIIVDIKLAAGQSVGESYHDPVVCSTSLYVKVESGTIRGAIYTS